MIEIREEQPDDIAAIRDVNTRAFGQDQEARIVDRLRQNGAARLSLVATLRDRVVGHIMYSPIAVGESIVGAALGPMAVLPEHQGQGIGSMLVRAGTARLEEAGCPCILVIGHPAFYPRFGFTPARAQGITCEWDVPDDVFMVLVLDPLKMQGITGLARYREEFSTAVS